MNIKAKGCYAKRKTSRQGNAIGCCQRGFAIYAVTILHRYSKPISTKYRDLLCRYFAFYITIFRDHLADVIRCVLFVLNRIFQGSTYPIHTRGSNASNGVHGVVSRMVSWWRRCELRSMWYPYGCVIVIPDTCMGGTI